MNGLVAVVVALVCPLFVELQPAPGSLSLDGVAWESGTLFDVGAYRGDVFFRLDVLPCGMTRHSLQCVSPGQDAAMIAWTGESRLSLGFSERQFWREWGDVGYFEWVRVVPEPAGFVSACCGLCLFAWRVGYGRARRYDVARQDGGGAEEAWSSVGRAFNK